MKISYTILVEQSLLSNCTLQLEFLPSIMWVLLAVKISFVQRDTLHSYCNNACN